jgi:hypothetical protein
MLIVDKNQAITTIAKVMNPQFRDSVGISFITIATIAITTKTIPKIIFF